MKKPISIINQDVLIKLLELLKNLDDENEIIEKTLRITLPVVEDTAEKLHQIILDYLGVPPDTTTCYLCDSDFIKEYNKEDEECQKCTGCYCRDWISDYIFEYREGEISLQDVLDKLIKWKEEELKLE